MAQQQQEEFQAAPAPSAAAEAPVPCANTNCGFFGSRATLNLCSQCFRKSSATAAAAAAAATAGRVVEIEISSAAAQSVPVVVITGKIQAQGQQIGGNPGRCGWCRKRVGLSAGFKCRCGSVFCSQHRYSDEHQCGFDYKAAGRESIAKANPLVVASKINKI